MAAGKYDGFIIEQGVAFDKRLTYYGANSQPKDLTNYTAAMMVKKFYAQKEPLIHLTTPGNGLPGGITLGGSTGTINLYLDEAKTAALDFDEAYYDLELYDSEGKTKRLLYGKITFLKEITKEIPENEG